MCVPHVTLSLPLQGVPDTHTQEAREGSTAWEDKMVQSLEVQLRGWGEGEDETESQGAFRQELETIPEKSIIILETVRNDSPLGTEF